MSLASAGLFCLHPMFISYIIQRSLHLAIIFVQCYISCFIVVWKSYCITTFIIPKYPECLYNFTLATLGERWYSFQLFLVLSFLVNGGNTREEEWRSQERHLSVNVLCTWPFCETRFWMKAAKR